MSVVRAPKNLGISGLITHDHNRQRAHSHARNRNIGICWCWLDTVCWSTAHSRGGIVPHGPTRSPTIPGVFRIQRITLIRLVNKKHWADMVVHAMCAPDGEKRFSILREDGSALIRYHVLRKMLQEEMTSSFKATRIVPENYSFKLIGVDTITGRRAYVLD
jgi:hypothetical protein